MCDGPEAIAPEAWKETWRTARKAHLCCACDETIGAGHRYHYASGIWDGMPQSYKHCGRCWVVYAHACSLPGAYEAGPDLHLSCGLTVEDVTGDPPSPEIAGLAFWIQGDPIPGDLA